MSGKNHPDPLEAILGPKFGSGQDFFRKSGRFFLVFFRIELKNAKKIFYPIVRSGHLRLFFKFSKIEVFGYFLEIESSDRSDIAYYESKKC